MVVASWSRKSISGNRWKEEKDSIFGNCHQVPEKRGEESVKLQWTATAEINHKGDIFVEPGLSVCFDLFTNEWEWSCALFSTSVLRPPPVWAQHFELTRASKWEYLRFQRNFLPIAIWRRFLNIRQTTWTGCFFYSSLQKTNRDGVVTPKNCLLRLSKSIFVLSLL